MAISLTVGSDSLRPLKRALDGYVRALKELYDEIDRAARLALREPASYLPEDLTNETAWISALWRSLTSNDEHLNIFGRRFEVEELRIIASAFALWRAELVSELVLLENAPVPSAAAIAALRDRIALNDGEVSRFWGTQGLSPCFAEVDRRRRAASGQRVLSEEDRAKTWCVCDTNLFIQYATFNEVDWPKRLKRSSVVLVAPSQVTRELDRYKADRDRPRQQGRARTVLPILERIDAETEPGEPAPIRRGVELLLLSNEPPIPPGFDPSLPDDRIVAAALDLRRRYVGADVVVLSGDATVRIKARGQRFEALAPPDDLELPSFAPAVEAASGENATKPRGKPRAPAKPK